MSNLRIAVVSICMIVLLAVGAVHAQTNLGNPPSAGSPTIQGCPVFPADNLWNRDVSRDQVDPNSDTYIASMNGGPNQALRANFGRYPEAGFPYVVVDGTQHKVPIQFTAFGNQSDPGPYPIPSDAPVEGLSAPRSFKRVIVIDKDNCMLYEMAGARYVNPGWLASSGAVFDLRSDNLRPEGWRSADDAGLPIFPGLVRIDEVQAGAINHALRLTVWRSQRKYIFPARSFRSGSADSTRPAMGMRVRLKANFDISSYPSQALVILTALKKYGAFIAENADESWDLSGTSNVLWDRESLDSLRSVPGTAFEVVQSAPDGQTPIPSTLTATPTVYTTPLPSYTPAPTAASDLYKVQYEDTDSNAADNQISPFLNVLSNDNNPVPLSELKIRYYFTRDSGQSLIYNCDWAEIGCQYITSNFVSLDKPVGGADTYLEIGFNPDAGNMAPYDQSGPIQGRIHKSDWSNFNKADDYSFDPSKTGYGDAPKIALYRNNTLIWGVLPSGDPLPTSTPLPSATFTASPLPPPVTAGGLKVRYRAASTILHTDEFSPYFSIVNLTDQPVALNTIKLRYYFTRDSGRAMVFHCDWAAVGCENLTTNFVHMKTPMHGADFYLEIGFTDSAGVIAPKGETGEIEGRISHVDWSTFFQENDYSFDASKTALADWDKVVLYSNDTLIWGVAPEQAALLALTALPTFTPTTSPTPSMTPTPTQ